MVWAFLMNIVRRCLSACFKIAGKELSNDIWNAFEQFIKFLLVGCSNTVVVLIVYYVVVWIGGTQYYLLGQTLGYGVGILNSYFWNSRYVFSRNERSTPKTFVKMCICYGATYIIQISILYILVDILTFSEFLSPIIAIIITTPINFILNRVFAFKEKNH